MSRSRGDVASSLVRLGAWRPRHPILTAIHTRQRRLAVAVRDRSRGVRFAAQQLPDLLPVVVARHASPLRRRLLGTDPRLQETKIVNLRLAAATLDRLVLQPGETASFWKRVGRPSAERGFREGVVIVDGQPAEGIGGGLCQLSNLLYWLALHTELEVVERHHHTVDAFPDDRRELPFGTGASVAFDLVDFRLRNPTTRPFQIEVAVDGDNLTGAIRTTESPPVRYEVFEADHRFEREHDLLFRCNDVRRRALDPSTGEGRGEELLMRNRSRVVYAVDEALIAPRGPRPVGAARRGRG